MMETSKLKHLFNAATKTDEDLIRDMVMHTISVLRSFPKDKELADVGFDLPSTHVVANLIEIGAAPCEASITTQMRQKANMYGSVRIAMNPSLAQDMARLIEVGLMRHQHGVDNPEGFQLH